MTVSFHQRTLTCWVSQSRVFATNSGIFISGSHAYLVDPGITSEELDATADFVASRGAQVRGIILTHAHWDHLLGPAVFPTATVIAHAAYTDVISSHDADLRRQVSGWQLANGVDAPRPFVPPWPDIAFDGCVIIHLGSLDLLIMSAPGHAQDHCVVYEPSAGLLWAGDMLSDTEIPMVMDTFGAYRQTLRTLVELEIADLVPGHGTPTDDQVTIRGRFEQDRAYLEAVRTCADRAVAEGASLAETVAGCNKIPFVQPDSYPHAHQWNIEQAYLGMGGAADGVAGWEKDWFTEETEC